MNETLDKSKSIPDPFASQRKLFNEGIIKIINMLNQVFTNNFVPDENNKLQKQTLIKTSKGQITYTYEPLSELFRLSVNQMDGQVKNTLFRKVCKNLVVLFAKPLPPKLNKSKASLALADIKPEEGKRIIITTKDGKEIVDNVKTEVCSEHEIYDFKNYMYLKLKLLIYLNDILNLNMLDDKNKYEKLFLDYLTKNPGKDISMVKTNFVKWMQQVETIIQQVMSDAYEFAVLRKMVALFENGDPLTVELCESLVPLCDNASSLDAKEICSPKRITMHSVTEDVCNPNLLYDEQIAEQVKNMKDLDLKINKDMDDIPVDLNEFNDQVRNNFDEIRKRKKEIDDEKKQVATITDKKKSLQLIEKINQQSKNLLKQLEKDPVLNIQKEVNKIDFEKIKDPQLLKKATLALEKFGNLFEKDKGQKFFRDITNINRDLKTSPFVARSSLRNLFDQQVKPVFEQKLDRAAVDKYYQDLQKKTEKELLDQKTGYTNWFKNVVAKSKIPPQVQQQVQAQANQRVQGLSQQLATAKTPAQKAQVVKQFQQQEKQVLDFFGKQLEDRKKLIESLNPVARKAFVDAFAKTNNIQEQQDLIASFKNLPQGQLSAPIIQALQNRDLTPGQLIQALGPVAQRAPVVQQLISGQQPPVVQQVIPGQQPPVVQQVIPGQQPPVVQQQPSYIQQQLQAQQQALQLQQQKLLQAQEQQRRETEDRQRQQRIQGLKTRITNLIQKIAQQTLDVQTNLLDTKNTLERYLPTLSVEEVTDQTLISIETALLGLERNIDKQIAEEAINVEEVSSIGGDETPRLSTESEVRPLEFSTFGPPPISPIGKAKEKITEKITELVSPITKLFSPTKAKKLSTEQLKIQIQNLYTENKIGRKTFFDLFQLYVNYNQNANDKLYQQLLNEIEKFTNYPKLICLSDAEFTSKIEELPEDIKTNATGAKNLYNELLTPPSSSL